MSNKLQILRALIFDVDGTIAETEEAHRAAFNAAFKHFHLDWRWDRPLYKSLLKVTGGKERMRHFAEQHRPGEANEIVPLIADIHAVKTEIFGGIVASGSVKPRPGVVELMKDAQANGIKLAIATTMGRPSLDALLPKILAEDCYEWFATIATGDRVAKKKPAPDLYDLALKELSIAPEQAIAIEDSAVGLQAALTAGIATVITPSSYTADDVFEGATAVIPELTSDLSAVDGLSRFLGDRP